MFMGGSSPTPSIQAAARKSNASTASSFVTADQSQRGSDASSLQPYYDSNEQHSPSSDANKANDGVARPPTSTKAPPIQACPSSFGDGDGKLRSDDDKDKNHPANTMNESHRHHCHNNNSSSSNSSSNKGLLSSKYVASSDPKKHQRRTSGARSKNDPTTTHSGKTPLHKKPRPSSIKNNHPKNEYGQRKSPWHENKGWPIRPAVLQPHGPGDFSPPPAGEIRIEKRKREDSASWQRKKRKTTILEDNPNSNTSPPPSVADPSELSTEHEDGDRISDTAVDTVPRIVRFDSLPISSHASSAGLVVSSLKNDNISGRTDPSVADSSELLSVNEDSSELSDAPTVPTVPNSISNTITIGLPSTTASSSKNGSTEDAIDGGPQEQQVPETQLRQSRAAILPSAHASSANTPPSFASKDSIFSCSHSCLYGRGSANVVKNNYIGWHRAENEGSKQLMIAIDGNNNHLHKNDNDLKDDTKIDGSSGINKNGLYNRDGNSEECTMPHNGNGSGEGGVDNYKDEAKGASNDEDFSLEHQTIDNDEESESADRTETATATVSTAPSSSGALLSASVLTAVAASTSISAAVTASEAAGTPVPPLSVLATVSSPALAVAATEEALVHAPPPSPPTIPTAAPVAITATRLTEAGNHPDEIGNNWKVNRDVSGKAIMSLDENNVGGGVDSYKKHEENIGTQNEDAGVEMLNSVVDDNYKNNQNEGSEKATVPLDETNNLDGGVNNYKKREENMRTQNEDAGGEKLNSVVDDENNQDGGPEKATLPLDEINIGGVECGSGVDDYKERDEKNSGSDEPLTGDVDTRNNEDTDNNDSQELDNKESETSNDDFPPDDRSDDDDDEECGPADLTKAVSATLASALSATETALAPRVLPSVAAVAAVAVKATATVPATATATTSASATRSNQTGNDLVQHNNEPESHQAVQGANGIESNPARSRLKNLIEHVFRLCVTDGTNIVGNFHMIRPNHELASYVDNQYPKIARALCDVVRKNNDDGGYEFTSNHNAMNTIVDFFVNKDIRCANGIVSRSILIFGATTNHNNTPLNRVLQRMQIVRQIDTTTPKFDNSDGDIKDLLYTPTNPNSRTLPFCLTFFYDKYYEIKRLLICTMSGNLKIIKAESYNKFPFDDPTSNEGNTSMVNYKELKRLCGQHKYTIVMGHLHISAEKPGGARMIISTHHPHIQFEDNQDGVDKEESHCVADAAAAAVSEITGTTIPNSQAREEIPPTASNNYRAVTAMEPFLNKHGLGIRRRKGYMAGDHHSLLNSKLESESGTLICELHFYAKGDNRNDLPPVLQRHTFVWFAEKKAMVDNTNCEKNRLGIKLYRKDLESNITIQQAMKKKWTDRYVHYRIQTTWDVLSLKECEEFDEQEKIKKKQKKENRQGKRQAKLAARAAAASHPTTASAAVDPRKHASTSKKYCYVCKTSIKDNFSGNQWKRNISVSDRTCKSKSCQDENSRNKNIIVNSKSRTFTKEM